MVEDESCLDVEQEIERRVAERYRELTAQLPGFVVLVDRALRVRWINRFAPGLAEADVKGRVILDFIDPRMHTAVRDVFERALASGTEQACEVEGYGDGQENFWYSLRFVLGPPEADDPRVLVLTTDITRQKRAELALRASEARFREVLASIPDYVLELDEDRRVLFVNRYRSDADAERVLGQRVEDLAEPARAPEIRAKLEHLLETGEPVHWSAGSRVDGGDYVVRALRLDGAPPHLLMISTDVTHQERIGERLRESEERLERVIRGSNLGLWEADPQAGSVTLSDWYVSHLGTPGSMSFTDWMALVHPEDRPSVEHGWEQTTSGRDFGPPLEYRLLDRRTGGWLWVQSRARIMTSKDGRRTLVGTSLDITELRAEAERRRALERQLEHAQRLESIGQLAGGIAHDFNNLLTVIMSGIDLALESAREGTVDPADLDDVSTAARRAAELTRRLLAFGRRSPLSIGAVDVMRLVQEVVAMTRRVLPESIDVRTAARGEGPFTVRGDRGQIEQVLLNLCLNARDAMPQGGRLRIDLEREDRQVVVRVSDTGHGIPEAVRPRIFEPFFTTKPSDKGSGLGLAVVHGIVQQHQGEIRIETEEGVGTCMMVCLPVFEERPAAEPGEARRSHASGGERILLAEDEGPVRAVARRILQSAGYQVIEARDGVEAVEAVEQDPSAIHLVLLDAVMPRLDGWRAYERIRQLAPGIPVLFCSGYAANVIPADPSGEVPPILAKPFRPETLLDTVRRLLDAAAQPADLPA